MKYKYIIFLYLFSTLFGQASIDDLKKLNNKDLDLIKSKLQSDNKVLSIDQPSLIEEPNNINLSAVSIKSEKSLDVDKTNNYFGYSYFKKDINFYDNTPTPADYKLGPGDEIIISLWGQKNARETFIINKNGMIYYENIGFINLSNQTLESAELVIREELSRIYSTLKDKANSTNLILELGRLKSMNIYFSGHIESPGINLIHPFSDIFSSIIQAGGIKQSGSLRTIQLIRNGLLIDTIDFYAFFMKGENKFSNTKIIDGDVIHIPNVQKRVLIDGEINRPGFYELLEGESLDILVEYASGFTAEAASSIKIDTINPLENRKSDDNAKSSQNIIFIDKLEPKYLNNGDQVTVNTIGDVKSKINIFGRIKNPGEYSSINSSLKNILDIAGGFDDPIFRKSIRDDDIVVIRKDNNQFYGLEFHIPYNESDNFMLRPEDQIFVYENSNYDNVFSVSISGEVNKRGTFPARKGMTVQDLINLAEGFTELANPDGIIITENFTSINDSGIETEEKVQINDAELDFELSNGATINVLPFENFVNITGNVYDPGLVVYSGRQSLKKYINLAGGPKPNTLTNRIYVKRANGRTKKVSLFRGLGISIKPGDTIFVPVDPEPSEFNITEFIADLSTTLANIAAILIIVDNND